MVGDVGVHHAPEVLKLGVLEAADDGHEDMKDEPGMLEIKTEQRFRKRTWSKSLQFLRTSKDPNILSLLPLHKKSPRQLALQSLVTGSRQLISCPIKLRVPRQS